MRSKPTSTFYAILRPIVRLGSKLFFRRIEVVGIDHFPIQGPVILVANHQNAMLDPVMCCVVAPRQLHWLTRADVFSPGLVTRALRSFNMMPVYRERDNVKDIRDRNQHTFDECFARMSNGAVVCLFPEGTHRGKKSLHPLKKGLARLADGAHESGLNDLKLLPVGLDYGDYFQSRSTLLIRFGEPIAWTELAASSATEGALNLQKVMDEVRCRLSAEMIDIQDEEDYSALMNLEPLVHSLYPASLNESFGVFQKVVHHISKTGMGEMRDVIERYANLSARMQLSDRLLQGAVFRPSDIWLASVWFVLVGVLALPALFFFAPVHFFVEYVVNTRVKDKLFYNSIRLVMWTFGTPVYLAISATVVAMAAGMEWCLGVLLCMPISAIIALNAAHSYRRWRMRMRVRKQSKVNTEMFHEWERLRKSLAQQIAEIATR